MRFLLRLLGIEPRLSDAPVFPMGVPAAFRTAEHDGLGWQVSERGNKFFVRGKWRITVFPNDGGPETLWKFCAAYGDDDSPFFSDHYFTEADAMADALRFDQHQPLLNNTYQAKRDANRRDLLPSQIEWQRNKLADLLAKIDRAKSAKTLTTKRVANLQSEADKRSGQAARLVQVAIELSATPDVLEQCRVLVEEHRGLLSRIEVLAATAVPPAVNQDSD